MCVCVCVWVCVCVNVCCVVRVCVCVLCVCVCVCVCAIRICPFKHKCNFIFYIEGTKHCRQDIRGAHQKALRKEEEKEAGGGGATEECEQVASGVKSFKAKQTEHQTKHQ